MEYLHFFLTSLKYFYSKSHKSSLQKNYAKHTWHHLHLHITQRFHRNTSGKRFQVNEWSYCDSRDRFFTIYSGSLVNVNIQGNSDLQLFLCEILDHFPGKRSSPGRVLCFYTYHMRRAILTALALCATLVQGYSNVMLKNKNILYK